MQPSPLIRRLINLLPLAGLLVLAWGLYGLLASGDGAGSSAQPEDPSLNAQGFALPTATEELSFQRSWVRIDATGLAEDSTAAAGTPEGLAPTLAVTPDATSPASARVRPTDLRQQALVAEPVDGPAIPDRLVIPAIDLDAPVVLAPTRTLTLEQQVFSQWLAPDDFAVGYHTGSAYLGKTGNTVLNGHHNVFGKVFEHLHELESGDVIEVYAGQRVFRYVVAQSMILKERGATLAEREQNARWILPSADERLTLVTCWPAESNTHRLLVVASPLEE